MRYRWRCRGWRRRELQIMLDFKLTQHPQETQPRMGTHPGAQIYDLIVLGGGPAGLTAAIYAGRAALNTLVLVGPSPGGQVSVTDMVENFPGFPEGIGGTELAQRMQRQAERFGARMVMDSVTGVDFSTSPFVIQTHTQTHRGRTVILATGAVPRRLGVPGEAEFYGRGVSTCATCDGFFYKDRRVVVVGGGDSAIDEGLFLTKFAREVVVVHRRDQLRATKIYQERAFANPKMHFVWDSVVEEILGEQTVAGVRVRNVKTGDTSVIETDGVFVYIGMKPGTKLLAGQVELDERGYVATGGRQHTSRPGVFAAGDVQSPDFRQVVVAAGSGAMAAIEATRFLDERSDTA
jgi:thioredoxin reductase (NADPH)